MGSDSNDQSNSGAADNAERKLSGAHGEAGLVKAIQESLHCSPAQARLSLEAVLSAIRDADKPLRIAGFGVFESDGKRLALRGFKGG